MRERFNFGVLLATVLVAALTAHANAQGFMVKPMTMQANPAPAQTIELPLRINNTAIDGPRTIQLRLVDLSQDDQGTWRLVEPNSGVDLSGHASSLAWTTLSTESVNIGPQQPADVTVTLKPPSDAHGYYFAGVVAETPLPESAEGGVFVRVRFLIPLIIEIRGRTVRQVVALDDVSMTFRADTGTIPTTVAAMTVTNSGQTYSRVRGELTIERQNDSRWRLVTRMPVNERGIIPGVTLKLGGDLQRRLPPGNYRLRAELFVDGRRISPFEKEIAFEGDPNVDALAYDTALILEPQFVEMDIAPGATRTTVVRIENPGTDPVRVSMASKTPRSLGGVEMGSIRGADLSAEPWTQIRPSEFTIRPGRWQNVRVIARVPRDDVKYPNYYADLTLEGTYPDGQSAGMTRSTVHLANTSAQSLADGSIEQISLAQGDSPTQYVVQTRFANVGNVHYEPTVRVYLLREQGSPVRNEVLSGEEGALLPLGKRIYSAELDFGGVEPGYYALRSVVTISPGQDITKQQIVLVESEASQNDDGEAVSSPRVTLLDPSTDELPGGMGASFGDAAAVPLSDGTSTAAEQAPEKASESAPESDLACGDTCPDNN